VRQDHHYRALRKLVEPSADPPHLGVRATVANRLGPELKWRSGRDMTVVDGARWIADVRG